MKKNELKKLAQVALYFLGLFAYKGASFILTPVYTSFFSTAEYGIIELANTVINFLGAIVGLGFCQYVGIEYFHFEDEERNAVIAKNIRMYLQCATPICIALTIGIFFNVFVFEGFTRELLLLVIFASYGGYFSNLSQMLCKNQQKIGLLTVLQCGVGILSLVLNVLGVCVWKWGIYSNVFAIIVTNLVSFCSVPFVYKGLKFSSKTKPNFTYIRSILGISLPLVLSNLVNTVLVLGDKWILQYYCSSADVGIYAIATKFGSVFDIIMITMLNIFYAPRIYNQFQQKGIVKCEKENRKLLKIYLLAGICLLILALFIIHLIFPYFIDAKFDSSERYIWVVFLGEIMLGAIYFRTYVVNYMKRTKIILFINCVGMVFNIVTNIIFIPFFGIWAAAYTTLASYIVMFLLATLFNGKCYHEALK